MNKEMEELKRKCAEATALALGDELGIWHALFAHGLQKKTEEKKDVAELEPKRIEL